MRLPVAWMGRYSSQGLNGCRDSYLWGQRDLYLLVGVVGTPILYGAEDAKASND